MSRTPSSATRAPFQERIGLALKARRETLKMTQEKFAELVEKHRVNCSEIENGKVNIQVETLEKLCLALKTKPWEIVKAADEWPNHPPASRGSGKSVKKRA